MAILLKTTSVRVSSIQIMQVRVQKRAKVFGKILKILGKESRPGGPPPVHEGGGAPPCLVGPLDLHRPQPQVYIFTLGATTKPCSSSGGLI